MASKKNKKGVTGKAITVANEPEVSPVADIDTAVGVLENYTSPEVYSDIKYMGEEKQYSSLSQLRKSQEDRDVSYPVHAQESGVPEWPVIEPEVTLVDVDIIPVEQPSIVSHPSVGVRIYQERDEAYTVQAGDLLLHPELSQQGVQLHDTVAYGSKWVLKSIVKGGEQQQVAWPVSISSQRY